MLTRLFLIRHGITKWNIQRRYCGKRDVPLSQEGRRQAKRLKGELKNIEFDKIYSSNKKRAIRTAKIIFPGRRFTELNSLREIDFGVLEGLRHKEIMKEYPGIYQEWLRDPYSVSIPKAERMQGFKKRVNSVMRKILKVNAGKTIAVVCHGGVIGVFISSLLKSRKFWRYVPKAGSVTVINKDGRGRFSLKRTVP